MNARFATGQKAREVVPLAKAVAFGGPQRHATFLIGNKMTPRFQRSRSRLDVKTNSSHWVCIVKALPIGNSPLTSPEELL